MLGILIGVIGWKWLGGIRKQKFEAKSKITRTLKEKTPRNKYNKVKKDREMFGYKISNNNREALLL